MEHPDPDHETPERKAIAGYYDEKMQSSDENLGKCSNKKALDDWELDRLVESGYHLAWPNNVAFPARTGPREGRALPRPAALTIVLHSQPPQVGGSAGSHGPVQHPPVFAHQHLAPAHHRRDSPTPPPTAYTHGSPAAEQLI